MLVVVDLTKFFTTTNFLYLFCSEMFDLYFLWRVILDRYERK